MMMKPDKKDENNDYNKRYIKDIVIYKINAITKSSDNIQMFIFPHH